MLYTIRSIFIYIINLHQSHLCFLSEENVFWILSRARTSFEAESSCPVLDLSKLRTCLFSYDIWCAKTLTLLIVINKTCSCGCVIVEEQKCISCAFDWDDGNMVSFRGSRVQFCDPRLPPLHHHIARNLHMAHGCRIVQIVGPSLSLILFFYIYLLSNIWIN